MANHNLGTIRGTIEIDYDGAGIVRAIRDTDKAKSSGDRLEKTSDNILKSFGKSVLGVAKFGAAINLVNGLVSVLANGAAILAPILAATFAVAPAVVLAFAGALVITKIALAGVGDALKAAGEGGKKFDDALKKLSPQAQSFVKAYQKAIPVLNQVKNAIQDAFFRGAAKNVGGIVTRIASLRAQAAGVAFAMGQIVQNVVKFATSGKSIEGIRTILSGLNAFLLQIRGSLGPVVAAFISLGAQAAKFGGVVGGTVNGALAALAAWLSSIDLAALFERAAPIIKSIGQLVGNLVSIFGSLFGGITADGNNAASMLTVLTGTLANFLKSAQGQSALAALGSALAAIGGSVGQVFMALLQAVTPIIIALAPGVAALAVQFSGALVPAIQKLTPLLVSLAGFLSDNVGWIGPLIGAVVALAGAYKVYAAVATAVGVAQDIIKSKVVTATATWIGNTAAIVANRVAQAASAAVTAGAAVAAWVASTAAIVANRVAIVAGTVAMAAARIATIAWTVVTTGLGIAMDFALGPIGLIIIAIAALVAGIIYAWKNSETFRNIVMGTWNALKAAAVAVWHAIVAAWNATFAGVSAALSGIASFGRAIWSGIVATVRNYINLYKSVITLGINTAKAVFTNTLNGIRAAASAVWSAIVAVVRGAINNVKAAIAGIKAIIGVVKGAFNSARSAASAGISAIVSLVRSLPGKASSALGGLAGLLYAKGRALIQGFINGIASMIGAVKSKVSAVVGAVTRFLPGSPAKEGPLSGRGYVKLRAQRFMADFAQGLQNGSQEPRMAVLGAVAPVARAVAGIGSGGSSGGSTASSSPSASGATRTYVLAVGGKQMAEFVVDAVTGAPVAVSKASNEGARRTAWAGSGR
jgi:hypothetical protein